MFNNISWQGYWATIALLTTGYYLSIYLLYFRNDFKILFRGKASSDSENYFGFSRFAPAGNKTTNPSGSTDSEEFQTPDKNSEEAVVYACIDELDAFFNESKKSKCLKDEMVSSLQSILKKYPSLKTSVYKASVTNVIVGQCEHICSIHLKADDVDRVWFG
jgi:hypothetical protein